MSRNTIDLYLGDAKTPQKPVARVELPIDFQQIRDLYARNPEYGEHVMWIMYSQGDGGSMPRTRRLDEVIPAEFNVIPKPRRGDTQPEIQATRSFDVAATTNNDDLLNRLHDLARELRQAGREIAADLLDGAAAAVDGNDPVTTSPIVRTAYFLSSLGDLGDRTCGSLFVDAAAMSLRFDAGSTRDFLAGVSAALAGRTLSGQESPSFRMGLHACLDTQRVRSGGTQVMLAADPVPPEMITTDPDDEKTSRHSSAPEPVAKDEPTAPHRSAVIPTRDPDAPRRRATQDENELTKLHMRHRTGRIGKL